MEEEVRGPVCVTGGTGYVASWLVMRLLDHGYSVRATVRSDPEHKKDTSYLTSLPNASNRLKLLHADLNDPDSFKAAIQGCTGVFHVAHPIDIDAKETVNAVTDRAVNGLLGILTACLDSKTVKKVVYTSSAVTVLYNGNKALTVNDENTWSDLEILRSNENFSTPYLVSKFLSEKTALEFAERNGLDLVTVVLPLVVGPFICHTMPSSVYILLTMIIGKKDDYKYILDMYRMTHVDDIARAQIFLFENPEANGRYICSAIEMSNETMFEYISTKYPEYELLPIDRLKDFKGVKRASLSSKKLLSSGFEFKYGIDEIFDGSIQCCKEKGLL